MMNWRIKKSRWKKFDMVFITGVLTLALTFSACSSPAFPTGPFSMQSDDDYVIEFTDSGEFTYYFDERTATSGTYSIQGNQLTWETDRVCDSLESGKATYLWSYENDTLTFRLKGEDRCPDRQEVLDNVDYVRGLPIKPTQQKEIQETIESDLSRGEVISPKNADQLAEIDRIITKQTIGIYSVAFSPDGRSLATGGHRTIKLWDADTNASLFTLRGHKHNVLTLAFSPDGRLLASGGREDSTVRLWDPTSGEALHTLELPTNYVNSVAISPDGSLLAMAGYSVHTSGDVSWISEDSTIILENMENGQQMHLMGVDNFLVSSLAFSPDGQVLASGGYQSTVLQDAASGERLYALDVHTNSVAFSPDGDMLATGGADGTVYLWDVETGKQLRTLVGYYVAISTVTFSPDGRLLAAGGDNGIVLWDTDSGEILKAFYGYTSDEPKNKYMPDVGCLAFSPDGRLLASGSHDRLLRLWGIPRQGVLDEK